MQGGDINMKLTEDTDAKMPQIVGKMHHANVHFMLTFQRRCLNCLTELLRMFFWITDSKKTDAGLDSPSSLTEFTVING